jgi:hypothetical protein
MSEVRDAGERPTSSQARAVFGQPRLARCRTRGCSPAWLSPTASAASAATPNGRVTRRWPKALLTDIAVAVLVDLYVQRGHFRRAERLPKRADAAGVAGAAGHVALADAY